MKYIDAEKLVAEIKRFSATEYGSNTFGDDVANGALDYVLEEIIPSLQQEQPECIYGRTLEERKKYCKFCSAICKARIEQEQPEVDLEKEVDATMKRYLYHITCREEQISFARHFYELGLKARKEV